MTKKFGGSYCYSGTYSLYMWCLCVEKIFIWDCFLPLFFLHEKETLCKLSYCAASILFHLSCTVSPQLINGFWFSLNQFGCNAQLTQPKIMGQMLLHKLWIYCFCHVCIMLENELLTVFSITQFGNNCLGNIHRWEIKLHHSEYVFQFTQTKPFNCIAVNHHLYRFHYQHVEWNKRKSPGWDNQIFFWILCDGIMMHHEKTSQWKQCDGVDNVLLWKIAWCIPHLFHHMYTSPAMLVASSIR